MIPEVDQVKIGQFIQRIIMLNPKYVINSQAENEFDCLKFFLLTQKELFGRQLPTIHLEDDSLTSWIKLAVDYKRHVKWVTIDKPIHGCAVQMTQKTHPYHIGTWLDIQAGGVLHCVRGAGVSFSSLHDLKLLGWNRIIYDIPPV